jgi:chitin synthase
LRLTHKLFSYAFSNLDDISWGTKQDATPDIDLGIVVQNAQSQVDLEMHSSVADVNDIYDEALGNLKRIRNGEVPVSAAPEKKSRSQTLAEKEQAAKNYYANVRTNVLLSWVLSNVSVCYPFFQQRLDKTNVGVVI